MSLKIIEAKYGSEQKKFVNVTDKVKSIAEENSLSILPTNHLFGGDPCPNLRKDLYIK